CGLFFFQAEDGIRAFHVTGVQTCALPILVPVPVPPAVHIVTRPISLSERSSSCRIVVMRRAPLDPSGCPIASAPPFTFTRSQSRSEERRGGKERQTRRRTQPQRNNPRRAH